MREYWKTSLFLYEVQDTGEPTPVIVFWRATVFTFGVPASKRTLKNAIREISETGEVIEPKDRRLAWEKRQVPASDSRGLGFNWIELSKGKKQGLQLEPEERVAVWNLPAYEKDNARLGYAEFLGKAGAYGRDKRARLSMGRIVKSFWEWITR